MAPVPACAQQNTSGTAPQSPNRVIAEWLRQRGLRCRERTNPLIRESRETPTTRLARTRPSRGRLGRHQTLANPWVSRSSRPKPGEIGRGRLGQGQIGTATNRWPNLGCPEAAFEAAFPYADATAALLDGDAWIISTQTGVFRVDAPFAPLLRSGFESGAVWDSHQTLANPWVSRSGRPKRQSQSGTITPGAPQWPGRGCHPMREPRRR